MNKKQRKLITDLKKASPASETSLKMLEKFSTLMDVFRIDAQALRVELIKAMTDEPRTLLGFHRTIVMGHMVVALTVMMSHQTEDLEKPFDGTPRFIEDGIRCLKEGDERGKAYLHILQTALEGAAMDILKTSKK